MSLKFANFARATVATPPSGTGGLAFTVAAGKGALFPALGAGDYFYGVFTNASKSAYEVVKVTGRSTDSFTIDAAGRGVDGSSAATWNANDIFYLPVTKSMLTELWSAALLALSVLTPAADKVAYYTGAATAALADLTAFGRSLIGAASGAAARLLLSALGLNFDERTATLSGTDTYTGGLAPALTAGYPQGIYLCKFPNANGSTTPTVNLDAQGAITIKKGNNAALALGDITANMWGLLKYDGTSLLLLNPAKGVSAAADSDKWGGSVKTVSTSAPSGGADGDIWLQY